MEDLLTSLRTYLIVALLLIGGMYGAAGYTDIDPGETALVIKKLGSSRGILKEPLGLGAHWIEPFIYDVAIYNYQSKQYYPELKQMPSDTKDGQPIEVDASLEIGLEPSKIFGLHQSVGRDWYEQIVFPAFRASLRNTTTDYLSDVVYTAEGRRAIQSRVQQELRDHVETLGINVIVNLRAIRFKNSEFVAALEAKARAAQNVIIEQRNAEAAQQTAIKQANLAEGEKQKRIKAAEAQREELRLNGQGIRLQKEEEAKGILAIKRAEAEGARLQVTAYGSGATYASVKWAENLGPNVKVWGVPTGAPGTNTIMDLNGLLKGAFQLKE